MNETIGNLTLRPLVPLTLWATLAASAILLLVWYYRICRRRFGRVRTLIITGAMALSAACPLVILLNPTWLEPLPPPPNKPLLTVLLDRTPSMATCDPGKKTSRYEEAKQLTADLQKTLRREYDLRLLAFAETTHSIQLEEMPSSEPAQTGTTKSATTCIAGGMRKAPKRGHVGELIG